MLRRWTGFLALSVALVACKGGRAGKHGPRGVTGVAVDIPRPPGATAAAPAVDPTASLSGAAAASGSSPPAASGSPAAGRPSADRPSGDACRVSRGPIQLPFTGAATLLSGLGAGTDADPRILFNRDGVPRAVTLPAPAKKTPKRSERLSLGEPAERASAPGCAAASGLVFCLDRGGALHRSAPSGEGSTVVAQARPGSPVAAASIAGTHVVYAFLGDRRTSEGATTLAFAALDDGPPVLLSEDGAGATFVTLASRGEEVVSMYIDARRVLTPVHARILTGGAKLSLGPDAVVFVGSGTDGRTFGTIAQGGSGHELALLPVDKDDHAFGLAAIRIEEQPRDDATTTWSLYPAAPERPSVAATQGVWPIRVLRVRPPDAPAADAGAPGGSGPDGGPPAGPRGKVVLELGEVDAAGVFKSLCPVAEGASFSDLAMLVDRNGSLWIAYTDADGTWVEQRR